MRGLTEGLHPDSRPAVTCSFHPTQCCNEIRLRRNSGHGPGLPMKPLRLIATPTRNRRLNEILGLIVLVAAALLLLALASYTPSDPSLDTVSAASAAAAPAHNWT